MKFTDALKLFGAVALSALLGLLFAVLVGGCASTLQNRPERALFARLALSSVKIVADDGGIGSGTIVKVEPGKAFVLTAAHVTEDCSAFVVYSLRARATAKLIKADPAEDLALLEVDGDLRAPALRVAARDPGRYDRAWLMGSYDGFPRSPGVGFIGNASYPMPNKKHAAYLAIIPIYQGDSGGTLANADAELIGVPVEVPQDYDEVQAHLDAPVEGLPDIDVKTPLRSIVPVPGVGFFVGVWSIREFLKGTEVLP